MQHITNRRLGILAVAIAALTLGGCATFRAGDKDTEARLKRFEPTPGKSSIYVCREYAAVAAAGVTSNVLVDNVDIGAVKPNTFVHTLVEPGKHEIRLKHDGMLAITSPSITIQTKPGDVSFAWVGVTGKGWGAYTIDTFDTPDEARACVQGALYAVSAGQ